MKPPPTAAAPKTYQVEIKKSASKQIAALPKKEQDRVNDKIESLATNPRPQGVERLTDSDDQYRVRVGNYRIVYTIVDRTLTITVIRVGDRKDVYR